MKDIPTHHGPVKRRKMKSPGDFPARYVWIVSNATSARGPYTITGSQAARGGVM